MIQIYFNFIRNIAAASHLVKEFRLIREFVGINRPVKEPTFMEVIRNVESHLGE